MEERTLRTPNQAWTIREARARDLPALVTLINRAFEIERAFKAGDRLDAAECAEAARRGVFLLAVDASGALLGCVHTTRRDDVATLGLLSVDPAAQGRGIGGALGAAVEARARLAGCRAVEIHVVNRREELFPFYRARGYVVTGTVPFEHPSLTQPCHFVVMAKTLGGGPA